MDVFLDQDMYLESNLGSAALSYSITEGTRMHCALEKKRAFCCSGCRVAEGRRSGRAGSLDGRYQETQTVLFVALVHCFPYLLNRGSSFFIRKKMRCQQLLETA